MKKLLCPVCSNDRFRREMTKEDLNTKYHLIRCTRCSLVFVNPIPEQGDLKKYYNEIYSVPLHQQEKVKKKGKKMLYHARAYGLPAKAKIFEIGSSHGFFLNEAKSQGYEVNGVELSKDAVSKAKKRFDIDIENKLFHESKAYKKKNTYDMVVLFDVLEHLNEPKEIVGGIS